MIPEFVTRWEARKDAIRKVFARAHPDDYTDIVKTVIANLHPLSEGDYSPYPDPERIVKIDHGHYQGTLVFVIGAEGYQPSDYWYVFVDYGSCSGCDTLEAIRSASWTEEKPTEGQIDDYIKLALHIVQKLKKMGGPY